MIKKVLIGVCLQFLWFTCVFHGEATSEEQKNLPTDTQYSISSSKIRGAYWGIKGADQGEEHFRVLNMHGLDTALVKDTRHHAREKLWREWGDLARKYNVKFFPVFNFAGKNEIKHFRGKFLPYVDRTGTVFSSTPCPLDASYWNASVGRRLEQAAFLAKTTGISGAVIDTEMYGSDFSVYRDMCFCDACWSRFILHTEHRDVPDITPKNRFSYLTQHALLEQYTAFQEGQLQEILSAIEKYVHNTNPSFSVGSLAFQRNWFYRGIIRGLGTVTSPLKVFSETSYVRGYTPHVDQEKAFIVGDQDTHSSPQIEVNSSRIAQYIPGIWMGRFFPEDLPSQLYNLAIHTDGYWVYNADSLWTAEKKPEPWALHGDNTDYLAAIKKANNELSWYSQAPDIHQSDFPPIHLSSFYDEDQNRLIFSSSLEHFMYTLVPELSHRLSESDNLQKSHNTQMTEVTYRGKTLFHCVREDTASIRITHVPLSKYQDQTHYRIFGSDGLLLREGTLNRENRSVTLTLPLQVSKRISLFIDSGKNATKVSFSGLVFVIEASSTFPLETISTIHTYGVYIKPGKEWLNLRAYAPQVEPAFLTVQSPDNSIHQQTELTKLTEIRVPVPSHAESQNSQKLWKISVAPVPSKTFEDVKFYLVNEEFPYLIVDHATE